MPTQERKTRPRGSWASQNTFHLMEVHMTGIERLREFVAGISPVIAVCGVTKTSYDREHMEEAGACLRDFLADIAGQIERERACDADTIENVRLIVGRVIDDMERHVSGVEGMEDSPVARWARELREALGGDGRDPAADVSVSAYDLLPQEDREAIAWVRYHGGRDEVRMELDNLRGAIAETCARLGVERSGDLTADAQGIWRAIGRLKSLLGDSAPRAAYERRRQRLLGHIAECETALGRRREIISELNHRVCDLTREIAQMRPRLMTEGMEWLLEAWPRFEDGEPVRVGDEVDFGGEGGAASSVELQDDGHFVIHACDGAGDYSHRNFRPGERVKRPVADTWERLEEDVAGASCPDVYCANHHIDASDTSYEWAMARDIVRRAKKLAERSE